MSILVYDKFSESIKRIRKTIESYNLFADALNEKIMNETVASAAREALADPVKLITIENLSKQNEFFANIVYKIGFPKGLMDKIQMNNPKNIFDLTMCIINYINIKAEFRGLFLKPLLIEILQNKYVELSTQESCVNENLNNILTKAFGKKTMYNHKLAKVSTTKSSN